METNQAADENAGDVGAIADSGSRQGHGQGSFLCLPGHKADILRAVL